MLTFIPLYRNIPVQYNYKLRNLKQKENIYWKSELQINNTQLLPLKKNIGHISHHKDNTDIAAFILCRLFLRWGYLLKAGSEFTVSSSIRSFIFAPLAVHFQDSYQISATLKVPATGFPLCIVLSSYLECGEYKLLSIDIGLICVLPACFKLHPRNLNVQFMS